MRTQQTSNPDIPLFQRPIQQETTEAQRGHELALAEKNQEQMLEQREIIWQPQQTPAQQKAQRERERKRKKQCMKKMHLPKCVVDGVYDESKHQEEMEIKRKAYLNRLNPPRQDIPIGNGVPVKGMIAPPYPPYVQPDWEEMQKMFPPYEKTKCYQHYMDEQQIQEMRNQFDFRDRGGYEYQMKLLKRGQPQIKYSNQAGVIREESMIMPSPSYYPYPMPVPYVIPRDEKCRGIDEKIEDDILPKATRTQCASMCMTTNRKRMRGWQGGESMTDKQYVKHLETQRDTPGTSSQEFQSLDTQIWNLKQSICEKEKMYKINCRKFEKKQKEQEEKSQLDKLLPFAIGGLVIFMLLD